MSMFSVRCYLQNNVFFWLEVVLDAPNVSLSVSHAEHLQEVEESLVALLLSPRLQELARRVAYDFLLQSHVLNKLELALNPNLIFSAGKAHLGARVGNKLAVKILCDMLAQPDERTANSQIRLMPTVILGNSVARPK